MPQILTLIWVLVVLINRTLSEPIDSPEFTQCRPLRLSSGNSTLSINCCPPNSQAGIVDFRAPPLPTNIRIRRAAHLLDEDYVRKYVNATRLMRQLGPSDPWNFIQQANVHCAYCEGAYNQTGHRVELQIHGSWLFFPFHRAYLYFYERILGKLIGDDTFALPFWNWDSPDGMTIPLVYANLNSSLHDDFRDATHHSPTLIDLNFTGKDHSFDQEQLIHRNLMIMNRQMVRSAKTPELFMGQPYRAGGKPWPGSGTIETLPHNTVHLWVGDRTQKLNEDMGHFYSAGRDPIFFAHHANVDRMWSLWKKLPGENRTEFTDTDWLDSAFLFWDENKQLVRIRVRDTLDTRMLGYVYQRVPVPWLEAPSKLKKAKKSTMTTTTSVVEYPMKLESSVSLVVKRPMGKRSREELVVVDEIEMDMGVYGRFDVYINTTTEDEEKLLGSFVHVGVERKGEVGAEMMRTRLVLGLTNLLEEIGASGDNNIVVVLVPRTQNSNITIGGVWIEFSAF